MLDFASRRVARLRGVRDAAGLIAALRQGSLRQRRAAANALIEIVDRRAIEPLLAALRSPDRLLRLNAALALGEFEDGVPESPAIAEGLTRLLDDPDASVRAMAASGLGRAKGPMAAAALERLRNDESPLVRATVAVVLGGIPVEGRQEGVSTAG